MNEKLKKNLCIIGLVLSVADIYPFVISIWILINPPPNWKINYAAVYLFITLFVAGITLFIPGFITYYYMKIKIFLKKIDHKLIKRKNKAKL